MEQYYCKFLPLSLQRIWNESRFNNDPIPFLLLNTFVPAHGHKLVETNLNIEV